MTLWLYAILPAPPGAWAPGGLGTGLAGEPLELLSCGGLWVAAGRVDAPPIAAEPALRAHDAVVRRLQEVSEALLPIRFGQTVPDETALVELLAPRQPALARALEEVAGCRQMTLRVLAPAGPAAGAASSDVAAETSIAAGRRGAADVAAEMSAAGARGTRYLTERREAARRRRSLPEIAPLLAELAPLVRAERIERGGPPPLVGSAYHLVPAERAGEWVARLESAVAVLAAAAPAPVQDALGPSSTGADATGASAEHRSVAGRSGTGSSATGRSVPGPSVAEPDVRSLAPPVPRLAWSGPFPPWAFAPELA